MANTGAKGDGWLKAAFWAGMAVALINFGLRLYDLIRAADFRWLWMIILLGTTALFWLVAFGLMLGLWKRSRLPRK